MKKISLLLIILFVTLFIRIDFIWCNELLIPMDRMQTNHLRAYGLTYQTLADGNSARWLLNYRGGSFLLKDSPEIRKKATIMGITFEPVDDSQIASIMKIIKNSNMDAVLLEKAPKIAVYTPKDKDPWDDAVTMALTYAEIPFDKVWDNDVLSGKLSKYDWLHLHHEDFTGQYGKFWASFRNKPWYVKRVQKYIKLAHEAGFKTVREHKLAVAKTIKEFVLKGGFLFAMCSATDTIDIALAANGVDIIPPEIDNTPMDPQADQKLDFSKCFAFENFTLEKSAYVYEFSNIDIDSRHYTTNPAFKGDFVLFDFSAKLDRSPTILTQDHVANIKGFLGQTTAFNAKVIKKNVIILGRINKNEVKYIYGNLGKGNFTFYAGHDPEDFAHMVGEAPTNLDLHKSSPGYRLILNNILFPAVKKKKLKT